MVFRLPAIFLGIALLVAGEVRLQAQSPLDAISNDAAIVLRLKNPKGSIDKVAGLVDAVKPGMGEQVRGQAGAIGLLISNPTLAGVNMEQDWYAAVYVPEGANKPSAGGSGQPEVVFVVPATDLAAMKGAMDTDIKFLEHGKFGVYTGDDLAGEKTEKRLKGEGASIAGLIDKDSTVVFDQGEVAVFINVKHLLQVYADEIEQGLQEIRAQLANVPAEAPPGSPGINPKQILEIAGKFLSSAESGMKDALSCTISANVTNDGVAFEDVLRFTADSPSTRFIARHKPSAMSILSKLPAGAAGYFGVSVNMPELMNLSMEFTRAALGEKGQEFATGLKELNGLAYGATASSFALGSMTEGIFRTISVAEVSDPQKLRDVSRKMMKSVGTIDAGNGLKQKFELSPDAETVAGNKLDLMKIEFDFDANDPMAAMIAQYMQVFYGPEGMATRSVFLKDRMVQTAGGGTEAMEQALASLNGNGAPSDAPSTATRARLSNAANLLLLMDLPGTVGKALQLVGESDVGRMFLPLDEDTLKALELPSSYTGLSLVGEPQGVRVKTQVPVEQIRGVMTLVEIFQKLNPGLGAVGAAGSQVAELGEDD